jgi:hypothetical protein
MSSIAASHHSHRNPGAPAILIAAILGATPACADPPRPTAEDSGICSDTAEAANKACGLDAEGGYWLAVGACQNQPNASRRQRCLTNASNERSEARALCRDQFEARDDVCDVLGQAAYHPAIVPSNFVKEVTNKYFPLKPGTAFIYRGETDAGVERVVVRVQRETRNILGVECTQVRDTVTIDGEVAEDTLDWYAQDKQGNVWYFGESTQEFEDGLPVSLEGSWRGGVDGAKPGIIMKAHPNPGDVYRQEFLLGSAEDIAEVVGVSGNAMTPAASCHGNCVVTHEFTPLEPDLNERKYYAPNVGFILEIDQETGDRLKLIELRRP